MSQNVAVYSGATRPVSKRKRAVHACLPCYSKKQKCNRQYPCDHCTKRRRPELCTYLSQAERDPPNPAQSNLFTPPTHTSGSDISLPLLRRDGGRTGSPEGDSPGATATSAGIGSTEPDEVDSLAELFGYSEVSDTNTLGILRRFGLDDLREQPGGKDATIPASLSGVVTQELCKMPPRPILNFLIHFFFREVHWATQCVHSPSFLVQYEQWWSSGIAPSSSSASSTSSSPSPLSQAQAQAQTQDTVGGLMRVADVEFAVLLLRICGYAAQFPPAPRYAFEAIRGVSLDRVQRVCLGVAERLYEVCLRACPRGSLVRCQHLSYEGLHAASQGRMKGAWSALCRAIEVAQSIGLQREPVDDGLDEIEKEWRRRMFWNLYIWDSMLSRTLDRAPFLVGKPFTTQLPKMHLPSTSETTDPSCRIEHFTERILAAKLWQFWNSVEQRLDRSPNESAAPAYDPAVAEERYDRFCHEYVPAIPAPYSLDLEAPSPWDEKFPMLPKQRELFYLGVYDSLCHNFKHLLRLTPAQVRAMPGRKQALLRKQRTSLARATLFLLNAVSRLHELHGSAFTRMSLITLYTFEPAVLLACLCLLGRNSLESDPEGNDCSDSDSDNAGCRIGAGDESYHLPTAPSASSDSSSDVLRRRAPDVSRQHCIHALEAALHRLEAFSDGCAMAQTGAKTLARLLTGVKSPDTRTAPSPPPSCETVQPLACPEDMRPLHIPVDPSLLSVPLNAAPLMSMSADFSVDMSSFGYSDWYGHQSGPGLGEHPMTTPVPGVSWSIPPTATTTQPGLYPSTQAQQLWSTEAALGGPYGGIFDFAPAEVGSEGLDTAFWTGVDPLHQTPPDPGQH